MFVSREGVGDAFGDLYAELLQRGDLVGIIGHQPDTLEAEMAQHLRGR